MEFTATEDLRHSDLVPGADLDFQELAAGEEQRSEGTAEPISERPRKTPVCQPTGSLHIYQKIKYFFGI